MSADDPEADLTHTASTSRKNRLLTFASHKNQLLWAKSMLKNNFA
jgi:hypothetical protein